MKGNIINNKIILKGQVYFVKRNWWLFPSRSVSWPPLSQPRAQSHPGLVLQSRAFQHLIEIHSKEQCQGISDLQMRSRDMSFQKSFFECSLQKWVHTLEFHHLQEAQHFHLLKSRHLSQSQIRFWLHQVSREKDNCYSQ